MPPSQNRIYITGKAVESFSQSISRATFLSYTAGTADFDSMNNFAKGEDGDGSNLEQAREAIEEANVSLKKAVSLLVEITLCCSIF